MSILYGDPHLYPSFRLTIDPRVLLVSGVMETRRAIQTDLDTRVTLQPALWRHAPEEELLKEAHAIMASVGGAIEALVRAVAQESAPRRLNVVSRGTIDIPMFGPSSSERDTNMAKMTAGNLIPRPGTADEVAQALSLCCRTISPLARLSMLMAAGS